MGVRAILFWGEIRAILGEKVHFGRAKWDLFDLGGWPEKGKDGE
jgi:hypothetical protein